MKAKCEPGQLVVTPSALTRIHPADVPIALGTPYRSGRNWARLA